MRMRMNLSRVVLTRVICALCACLVIGCEPDTGLRIEIVAEGFQEGVNIDELRVDLVASQNEPTPSDYPDEYVYPCRIASRVFSGEGLQFPLVITVHPGDILWECVGIRARGVFDQQTVIRAEELHCKDLHAGVTDVELILDVRCLTTEEGPQCQPFEVCAEGECEASRATSIFDANAAIVESCDFGEATEADQ